MVNQVEIHRKAQSSRIHDRIWATNQFHDNFSNLLDKKLAWEYLYRLMHDDENDVKWRAARALAAAFPDIPDKKLAWEELIRMTHDKNSEVWHIAANALDICFPYMPDKLGVWRDIHVLVQDKNSFLRWNAANVFGLAFSHIQEKELALEDLHQLIKDNDSKVRICAYHSLGRVSIFKATETESIEKFKKELEKALKFFRAASREATFDKSARFCLLIYKSFYEIAFKTERVGVHKYLTEAKRIVGGSENKEKLLEAVENLADALREVQMAEEMSLGGIKCDLNAYRRYCERAVDLLDKTEGKAPQATKLIKRGLPIIDGKIKGIIIEIQEKSKVLCKQTLNTPFEDLGKEVNRVGQTFPQVRDPIGLEKGFNNLWTALSSICAKMPEEERGEACKLLKRVGDEPYIEDKLPLINMVLSKISSQISAIKNIETVEKKLNEIMFSLKPGIREELIISIGTEFGGTGAQHVITIPLQEISYPDLKKDLEKIKGRGIIKLISLPAKLAEKVKDYLTQNKKDELQVI